MSDVSVRCLLCTAGPDATFTAAALDAWNAAMDHALDYHFDALRADPDAVGRSFIVTPPGRRLTPAGPAPL